MTTPREQHHGQMLDTLTRFLDIAKDDKSVITCGVMAVITEFLSHFQTGLRATAEGEEDPRISLEGIVNCQLYALRKCISDLEKCMPKGDQH